MRGCGVCQHKAWNLWCERGGGSKPQPAQIIQAPPPPSVVSALVPEHDGRAKLRPPAVMERPPPNVEVQVTEEALRTPPVKVIPFEEARPPPATERPEEVKVLVADPVT